MELDLRMCDCIAIIKKETEQSEYAVNATVGSFDSQRSTVSYRPITLAGVPSKHNRYTSVPWKYCPWCGQHLKTKGH